MKNILQNSRKSFIPVGKRFSYNEKLFFMGEQFMGQPYESPKRDITSTPVLALSFLLLLEASLVFFRETKSLVNF